MAPPFSQLSLPVSWLLLPSVSTLVARNKINQVCSLQGFFADLPMLLFSVQSRALHFPQSDTNPHLKTFTKRETRSKAVLKALRNPSISKAV